MLKNKKFNIGDKVLIVKIVNHELNELIHDFVSQTGTIVDYEQSSVFDYTVILDNKTDYLEDEYSFYEEELVLLTDAARLLYAKV